jgi:hypothetical protein
MTVGITITDNSHETAREHGIETAEQVKETRPAAQACKPVAERTGFSQALLNRRHDVRIA